MLKEMFVHPPSVTCVIKPFQRMLKLKWHWHFVSSSMCWNDDLFLIFAEFAKCQMFHTEVMR